MADSGPAQTSERTAATRASIARSRRAEPDLWRVPLLATLMVLLLAQKPAHAIPSGRAALLTKVIDNSVRLWEMRRAPSVVPGTAPEVTADILIDCFDDIARLVAADGSTPWQRAHEAIITRLHQHWGKPAGTAAAAARLILEHWDVAAGVFLSDAPQGTLTARTRLFAEIGEARWAVREPSALTAWMDEVIVQRPESARLAASLSPVAASALMAAPWTAAVNYWTWFAPPRRTELSSTRHPCMPTGRRNWTVCRTLPIATPASPHVLLDLDEGRSPRAQLIVRLASEDLDEAQTDELITAAAAMSPRLQAVISALCVQHQASWRGTELTDSELDVLQEALEALAGDEAEDDPGRVHCSDALVRAVVTHLLPRRPDVAPAVADASGITLDTLEWLETELPRLGHTLTLNAIRQLAPSDTLAWLARSAKDSSALFELMTELDDAPIELTPSQAWHLDEAAAFIDALAVKDFAAMTPPRAALQQPKLTRRILRLALDTGGYDGALVSAQLRSLQQEYPEKPDWGLLYQPSSRTPARTPTTVALEDDLVLQAVQHGNTWLVAPTLALAGTTAPKSPPSLAERLIAALPALNARTRMQTARFLARRWPELALPDADAVVRAGAAQAHAAVHADSQDYRNLQPLLADPDLLVRAQAARYLHDVPSADLPPLEQILARPAQQWTCLDCDTVLTADADTCSRSHPRPAPHLKTRTAAPSQTPHQQQ